MEAIDAQQAEAALKDIEETIEQFREAALQIRFDMQHNIFEVEQ